MKSINIANTKAILLIIYGFLVFIIFDSFFFILAKGGSLCSVFFDINPVITVICSALIYLFVFLIAYMFVSKFTLNNLIIEKNIFKKLFILIVLVFFFVVTKFYINFLYNDKAYEFYSYEKNAFFQQVYFLERLLYLTFKYFAVIVCMFYLIKKRKIMQLQ